MRMNSWSWNVLMIFAVGLAVLFSCGDNSDNDEQAKGSIYVDAGYTGADADGSADRPFPTIGEGLAHVAAEGTVFVAGGDYPENILFPEREGITVQPWPGRAPEAPHLQGQGDHSVVTIKTAAGAILQGLRITGGRVGVLIVDAERFSVIDNMIEQSELVGVQIENSEGLVSGNTVRENGVSGGDYGYGVQCSGGQVELNQNTIAGNTGVGLVAEGTRISMSGNQLSEHGAYGAQLANVSDLSFSHNTLSGNRGAALLADHASGMIEQSEFVGTGYLFDEARGIHAQGGSQLEIRGNLIQGCAEAGVVFTESSSGVIEENELLAQGDAGKESTGDGLQVLGDSYEVCVANNELSQNRRAGAVFDRSAATVRQNTFTQNTYGLVVQLTASVETTGNEFNGNREDLINSPEQAVVRINDEPMPLAVLLDSGWDDDETDDDVAGQVWEDPLSGLMWQNASDCCYDWLAADDHCRNLTWGGYADWRLPSISELRSLIRGCANTMTDGLCGVTDACLEAACLGLCWSCAAWGGPGPYGLYWPAQLTGDCCFYWSSGAVAGADNLAYIVYYRTGQILPWSSTVQHNINVRCVR